MKVGLRGNQLTDWIADQMTGRLADQLTGWLVDQCCQLGGDCI